MKTETLILKAQISTFFKPESIAFLMKIGYQKTGNKFHLTFAGSKGYLDHIEIQCEGYQLADNRINWHDLLKKTGGFKKENINVWHSDSAGVRLSLGTDVALVIIPDKKQTVKKETAVAHRPDEEDLPF